MAVIAMTREMATLGRDVAAGLAKQLGLHVVHHELVAQDIAGRAGTRGEPKCSAFSRVELGSSIIGASTPTPPSPAARRSKSFDLAVKGDVPESGLGRNLSASQCAHVVCVRICAPMPDRERVLMQRLGINDRATARREIERNDAAHDGTMQRLFGIDWTDPALYSLVLNSGSHRGGGLHRTHHSCHAGSQIPGDTHIAYGPQRPTNPFRGLSALNHASAAQHPTLGIDSGGRGWAGHTQRYYSMKNE